MGSPLGVTHPALGLLGGRRSAWTAGEAQRLDQLPTGSLTYWASRLADDRAFLGHTDNATPLTHCQGCSKSHCPGAPGEHEGDENILA